MDVPSQTQSQVMGPPQSASHPVVWAGDQAWGDMNNYSGVYKTG